MPERGSGKYFPRITIAQTAESKQRARVSEATEWYFAKQNRPSWSLRGQRCRVYKAGRWRYACENCGRIFWRWSVSDRGENSAICSRRSIPHLCSVRGMGRIATLYARRTSSRFYLRQNHSGATLPLPLVTFSIESNITSICGCYRLVDSSLCSE